jgi:enoyl-CoA hydratase/carnithine racemase
METIEVERAGAVVTITLNRPEKKNALSALMWDELREAFRSLAGDADVRVVVLTGAGGAFCSGADLTGGGPANPESNGRGPSGLGSMRNVGDVVMALHNLPQPTIAKVTGVAAGAGCNLALGCDLIVSSESGRFSQIFAKRGLSLDAGGSWLLPRLVGLHKAKELAFFADVISAQEAEKLGIVNHVVPDDDIDKFVDEWAERLCNLPPLALSMTKTMLNNSIGGSLHESLEDEARCQTVNFKTEDMAEAMMAFVNKTTPTFRGR